jgi:hypothetical protein
MTASVAPVHESPVNSAVRLKLARTQADDRERVRARQRAAWPSSAYCTVPVPTPVMSQAVIDADRPSSDPLARLVRAYDRAIRACEAFDHRGAREAIGLLRSALDLDSSASRSFDALYRWCEESVDQRDYIGAAQCLRALRDAWHQATTQAAQPDTRRRFAVRRDWPVS